MIARATATASFFSCRNAPPFYPFNLMLPISTFSEWDTCAGHVIVEESGGAIIRCTGVFERGMADVATLLQRAASCTATTVRPAEDQCLDLRVVYNKEDLASPRCIFLGSCDARLV